MAPGDVISGSDTKAKRGLSELWPYGGALIPRGPTSVQTMFSIQIRNQNSLPLYEISYHNVHRPVIGEIEGAVEDIRSGKKEKKEEKNQKSKDRERRKSRCSLSCVKKAFRSHEKVIITAKTVILT
jgi:hypothetical protein